jgi:hypothetical protein
MTQTVAGFPFWEIDFDDNGGIKLPAQETDLLSGIEAEGVTDLLVFSHGWNNDRPIAMALYDQFFGVVRQVVDARPPAPERVIGVVGVIWPAMRWGDEDPPAGAGGAAGLEAPAPVPSDGELVTQLKSVFNGAEQHAAIDELAALLDQRPDDPDALRHFQDLMGALTGAPDVEGSAEDNADDVLLERSPEQVFGDFADYFADETGGGAGGPAGGPAAGLGSMFGRLWDGAKNALRAVTYWQMKRRAGVVGRDGLGPLLGRVSAARPTMRINLMGHSFGARLVSFALLGIPDAALQPTSPVTSLVLIQGAFSHFAFAASLPQDPNRGGALAGMTQRVNGPLLVTHSVHDSAVGKLYPAASIVVGDDAAAVEDLMYRWGAMGHDGAQAVDGIGVATQDQVIAPAGQAYALSAGKFVNLDADQVIVAGGGIAGAHSDIHHPEVAWAVLAAANLYGD